MFFPVLSQSFPDIFQWVLHNGYWLTFLIMIIEGPIITVVASFAASLGYFNVFFIFLIAFLGDIVGDFIWYVIGYLTRLAVINKYGRYFGVSVARIEKLRKLLEKHSKKILLAIKLSPIAPTLGLVIVGNSHFPPKRFAKIVSLISVPKTIFFVVLGYFFGYSYTAMAKYFDKGFYGLLVVLVVFFIIFFVYKKIVLRLAQKLEREL